MKRKIGIVILSLFMVVTILKLYGHVRRDIVSTLEGKLFYTKRDEGIMKIYTSDADLENEELVYSHEGKGKDSYDEYNDNVIDFYYKEQENRIYFQAMHEGNWTIFVLDVIDGRPRIVDDGEQKIKPFQAYHIKKSQRDLSVFREKGSMYLKEDGKTRLLKKYYGIYDEKFASGYRPIGLSPDGKYLIYYSMGHLSPVGTLLEAFVEGMIGEPRVGASYIMDLDSGKINRYIDASTIQWLQ